MKRREYGIRVLAVSSPSLGAPTRCDDVVGWNSSLSRRLGSRAAAAAEQAVEGHYIAPLCQTTASHVEILYNITLLHASSVYELRITMFL